MPDERKIDELVINRPYIDDNGNICIINSTSFASTKLPRPMTAERNDVHIDPTKPFPGARKMRMPLKEAVEAFLRLKYGERATNGITKEEILNDDETLYKAIDNYKRDQHRLPFDMPTRRTEARRRFERVAEMGIENAPRRERDSAIKFAHRALAKPK